MRLIFVHGMRQEGKNPDELRRAWEDALTQSWSMLGLQPPGYHLEMPFYGNVLEDQIQKIRGGGDVLTRGGDAQSMSDLERELIDEYRKAFDISDNAVDQEVAQEIVGKGAANWEWVQGAARLLEKVPAFGSIGLKMVSQVDGYLSRPHIAKKVDDLVRPELLKGPCVVVAHSLGTIISYKLLRAAQSSAQVPLLITLGSPLGIEIVRRNLGVKNLSVPAGVGYWANGADQRDYVALHARLQAKPEPPEIHNRDDIHNSPADAHSIVDYLSDFNVARAIHDALAGIAPTSWQK